MAYKKRSTKMLNLLSKNILTFSPVYLYRKIYRLLNALRGSSLIDAYNIQQLKDKYKGKRCFIIGNGPSLKKTELGLLKNEITFGLNRIYLNFEKMGFYPTFLVSVNKILLNQCWREMKGLPLLKIFPSSAKSLFTSNQGTIFVRTFGQLLFSKDISDGVCEGSTVTYVAMQVAYYMGFSEVVLVGVDHDFVTKGKPNRIVFQKKGDPNHFTSKYFKGMKWQLPDLKTSELAYRLAKYYFDKDGRKILDATIGGKLEIFKKVSYEGLFNHRTLK